MGPFFLWMLMSDFKLNPNSILAINPYVNGDPDIRPDNSPKTIHSSLSTTNNITPAFLAFTTLVKATRHGCGARDNLDILVCVKPAVLAYLTPKVRAGANMSPHRLCCKYACRQGAPVSHLHLLLLCLQ